MTAAPTPGIAPSITPNTDCRITMGTRAKPCLAPRHTSFVLTIESGGATGRRAIARSVISGSAKKPSVTTMMGSPSQRLGWSNTNRTSPVMALMPTVPNSTPSAPAASPFTMAPALSAETIAIPKKATAAISGNPKSRMTGFTTGIRNASTIAPTRPPIADTA